MSDCDGRFGIDGIEGQGIGPRTSDGVTLWWGCCGEKMERGETV